jgi:hypothetical protein
VTLQDPFHSQCSYTFWLRGVEPSDAIGSSRGWFAEGIVASTALWQLGGGICSDEKWSQIRAWGRQAISLQELTGSQPISTNSRRLWDATAWQKSGIQKLLADVGGSSAAGFAPGSGIFFNSLLSFSG